MAAVVEETPIGKQKGQPGAPETALEPSRLEG